MSNIPVSTMENNDPSIGQTIAGYQLLEILGHGGMGVVYKARQMSLDRVVALKILPRQFATDQEYIQRFLQEARAAARLNHPHIIQIYDFGLTGELHFLAMEYLDGQSLSSSLKNSGVISEPEGLRIVMQVCDALGCAHESGIIHRDIKPDNILISHRGTAKLCDLGLAKLTLDEDISLTRTGTALGTPYYISPEQVRGDKELDHRTDIYSLGATLYHILTGRIPFDGPTSAVVMSKHLTDTLEDPRLFRPEISYQTTCLIYKMMEKSPADRYPHITEIRELILQILASFDRSEALAPVPEEPMTDQEDHALQQKTPGSLASAKSISYEDGKRADNKKSTPWKLLLGIFFLLIVAVFAGRIILLSKKPHSDNQTPLAVSPSNNPPGNESSSPLPPATQADTVFDDTPSQVHIYRRMILSTISPEDMEHAALTLSARSRVLVSVERPSRLLIERLKNLTPTNKIRLKAKLIIPLQSQTDIPTTVSLYRLRKNAILVPLPARLSEADLKNSNRPQRPGFLVEKIRDKTPRQSTWYQQTTETPWEQPGVNGSEDREQRAMAQSDLNGSTEKSSLSVDISEDFLKFITEQTAFLDYILISQPSSAVVTILRDATDGEYPRIEIHDAGKSE